MASDAKKIFISHRSLDSSIVNELVQYLENIGISRDDMFYTSADSTGVRYELAFEVKKALNEADIFIAILSNNYFDSEYCCNELGFLWAADKKVIVYGLPGIDAPTDYRGFVADWKIRRLNNPQHIDFLYDEIKYFSSKKDLSITKLNEYKNAYVEKANKIIDEWSTAQSKKEAIKNSTVKIFDIDTLVANGYYCDKELLFFKYLIDSNDYIRGIAEDTKKNIEKWEKKNRIKPFLSDELENFFVMLFRKNYLSNKIITSKNAIAQTYTGRTDNLSKCMMAALGTNEKGENEYNYFEIDERLFRAIVRVNAETINIFRKTVKKYKLKWYKRYPKRKK